MAMGINCNDPNVVTYVLTDCSKEKLGELRGKNKGIIKDAYLSNDYPAEMPPQEFYVLISKRKTRDFERAARGLKIKFSQIRSES